MVAMRRGKMKTNLKMRFCVCGRRTSPGTDMPVTYDQPFFVCRKRVYLLGILSQITQMRDSVVCIFIHYIYIHIENRPAGRQQFRKQISRYSPMRWKHNFFFSRWLKDVRGMWTNRLLPPSYACPLFNDEKKNCMTHMWDVGPVIVYHNQIVYHEQALWHAASLALISLNLAPNDGILLLQWIISEPNRPQSHTAHPAHTCANNHCACQCAPSGVNHKTGVGWISQ